MRIGSLVTGITRMSAAIAALALATPAFAQDRGGSVEGVTGWVGFVDESPINHGIFGGAVKWHPSPRVAIGPEIVYMIGPGSDRDLFVTGNVTFDVFARRPITPFFVAGGGMMHHSDSIAGRKFSSSEGAFTAGGGVRFTVGDRFYVAPEARLGWELHSRVSVAAGWRF
jgi:hypothetical protein